jgi:hypothetical protein
MPAKSSSGHDNTRRSLSDSDREALVELFSHLSSLYWPGITPLGEERARQLQANARAAWSRLEDDPSALFGGTIDDEQSWRSLPELDRQAFVEEMKVFCRDLMSAEGVSAVDEVMQEHYEQIVSWVRTAQLWENLDVDEVVSRFPGDGPLLRATETQSTSASRLSRARTWRVQAASQSVGDQWHAAAQRFDTSAEWILEQMLADPLHVGSPFPIRFPLQGSLRRATVAGRELEQWEISHHPEYAKINRQSKLRRIPWSGELKVAYAPDPQRRVIWVTTARPAERSRPNKKQQPKDPQRQRVEALHDALTMRLHTRMTAAGWHVDPTAIVGMDDGVVGHFRYPLNEDFSVTAWFAWLGEYPPLQVDTVVGVSYERTYRVWPYLLHGYPHSELRVGGEKLGRNCPYVELWELDEVDRAVDDLVSPVLDRALEWAEPFASIVDFLEALRTTPDDASVEELMDTPVVLAAVGRSGEGRQALAEALAVHAEEAEELLMDDFASKFSFWLASGAPPTPPDQD